MRRAFDFGYRDYPERRDPAAAIRSAHICKKDRPVIDPFSIHDAEVLIAALHYDWGEAQGNYDEFRFFTGLRPSEQIALVVSDYDAEHAVLSISKARVQGVDKDVTKTRNDRRVELCPRAVAVLERQLALRERLFRAGRLRHEQLFFQDSGAPIRYLRYPYARWHRTLSRLAIRYRKPYSARHTSVSWNLMLGRNPLWVAQQHGHSISTMLWVYAAWIEGASETDLVRLRKAMQKKRPPSARSPTYVAPDPVTRVEESKSAPQELTRNLEANPAQVNQGRNNPSSDAESDHETPSPASTGKLGSGLDTREGEPEAKPLKAEAKDVAERVGFEPTCRNYPTIRFRVGAVVTTSVPLRRNNLSAGCIRRTPFCGGCYSSGSWSYQVEDCRR